MSQFEAAFNAWVVPGLRLQGVDVVHARFIENLRMLSLVLRIPAPANREQRRAALATVDEYEQHFDYAVVCEVTFTWDEADDGTVGAA